MNETLRCSLHLHYKLCTMYVCHVYSRCSLIQSSEACIFVEWHWVGPCSAEENDIRSHLLSSTLAKMCEIIDKVLARWILFGRTNRVANIHRINCWMLFGYVTWYLKTIPFHVYSREPNLKIFACSCFWTFFAVFCVCTSYFSLERSTRVFEKMHNKLHTHSIKWFIKLFLWTAHGAINNDYLHMIHVPKLIY